MTKYKVQLSYAMSVVIATDAQEIADGFLMLEDRLSKGDVLDRAREGFLDWLYAQREDRTLGENIDVQSVALDGYSIEPCGDEGESDE